MRHPATPALPSLEPRLRTAIPRWVCSPTFLFSLGMLQAMFPYAYWESAGKNLHYSYDITGQPAIIWFIGWACFVLGVVFRGLRCSVTVDLSYSSDEMILAQRASISLLVISVIGMMSVLAGVYGGIPLLAYFDGSADVTAVNDLQASSWNGQLGFVVACNFALMMWLIIYWRNIASFTMAKRTLVILIILVVAFQSVMAGKRQGLAMLITALGCGFVLSGRAPGVQIAHLLGLRRRNRLVGFILAATLAFGFFFLFGFLAAIRNQETQSETVDAVGMATDQAIAYLQFPLINFEVQTATSAWGPGTNNVMGPLLNLIPYKIQQEYFADQGAWSPAPRAEPGIGSGFYGDIHWFWGMWGVIFFSLVAGYVCQWLYLRAAFDSISLAIYSHLAWTLIAAHSYNHFFTLVFCILPIGFFMVTVFLWGGWKSPGKSKESSRRC